MCLTLFKILHFAVTLLWTNCQMTNMFLVVAVWTSFLATHYREIESRPYLPSTQSLQGPNHQQRKSNFEKAGQSSALVTFGGNKVLTGLALVLVPLTFEALNFHFLIYGGRNFFDIDFVSFNSCVFPLLQLNHILSF